MRRGFTVLEVLLSLLLLALVLQAGWAVLSRQREAATWVARRAEGLETVRTVAWLLSEELAGSRSGEDWEAAGGDSVSLRAFRGLGMVLPGTREGSLARICYRGFRSPDPDKDSVLLLGRTGRWTPVGLLDRAPSGSSCRGVDGGREELWTLSAEVPGAVLARLFERGSYHLADSVFRYRRGQSGRQPLTPPRIWEGRLTPGAGGAESLMWEMVLAGSQGEPEGLPWKGGAG